jgi:hypothetical protein
VQAVGLVVPLVQLVLVLLVVVVLAQLVVQLGQEQEE